LIRQLDPDGTTTLFLAGSLYEVTLDAGGQQTAVKRYYAISGQPIALRDTGGTFYLLTDHLGSVVAVLDATGAVVGEQRYRPFGQPRLTPGITQTDRGFTGQQDLSEVGLQDFNARWFDTSLGMFASSDSLIPDPFDPQGLNRYSYAFSNPLRYTDPTGHRACEGPNGECWYVDPNPNIGRMPVQGWQTEPLAYSGQHVPQPAPAPQTFQTGTPTPPPSDPFDVQVTSTPVPSSQPSTYCSTPPPGWPPDWCLDQAPSPQQLSWSPSNVPWDEVAVDAFGIVADLLPLLQGPATVVEVADYVNDIATGVELMLDTAEIMRAYPDDLGELDWVNFILDAVSIVPEAGIFTSGLGLAYNLGKGFQMEQLPDR